MLRNFAECEKKKNSAATNKKVLSFHFFIMHKRPPNHCEHCEIGKLWKIAENGGENVEIEI